MLKNTAEDQEAMSQTRVRKQHQTGGLQLIRAAHYAPFKTALELSATILLLLVASPVILVAALLVRLTSSGPGFYTQTRIGRNGRPYTIYKLRSMRHDCEKESGACWSTAGDTRITPVGRFLRRTHIDELPQLWNVLRGDMSLVGPRPERPEFIPLLEAALPLYRARLLVRPGVTGLAQVQLHADTNLESVRRKLAYDLHYVANGNLWMDLRILVATAFHVMEVPYEGIGRFLRLPPGKEIEAAYERMALECRLLLVEV